MTETEFCRFAVNFATGYFLSCVTGNMSLGMAIGPMFVVPFSALGGFFINPE